LDLRIFSNGHILTAAATDFWMDFWGVSFSNKHLRRRRASEREVVLLACYFLACLPFLCAVISQIKGSANIVEFTGNLCSVVIAKELSFSTLFLGLD
jgi:hypothetical protein